MTEELEQKRRRCIEHRSAGRDEPPWMAGFGALSDLAVENRRVLDVIENEFERLSPQDVA